MVGGEGLLQTKYVAYTKLNSASDSAQRTAGGPRRRIQIRMYICMYIVVNTGAHTHTYAGAALPLRCQNKAVHKKM